MKQDTAVFYLTKRAGETAERLAGRMVCDLFGKESYSDGFLPFAREQFPKYQRLVFVMAAGIVVRAIAPVLLDKQRDPAVVVVDELGQFAISLLSGHIGGANALAHEVADILGATPVITTATDLNQVVAFDLFAKEQGLSIENIGELKYVSGALADGRQAGLLADGTVACCPPYLALGRVLPHNVVLSSRRRIEGLSGHTLWLCPKNLVLGIGCKRNTEKEEIEAALSDFLKKNNRRASGLAMVVSGEIKRDEAGILAFCKDRGLPFHTFPKERLIEQEGRCLCSEFVRQTTGSGSVCEAAVYCVEEPLQMICQKTAYRGITLALGEILLTWEI